MIRIEKMQRCHEEQVLALRVADEQWRFIATLEEILANTSQACHPYVIIAGGRVVGFFLIDTEYSENYGFSQPNCLGFRSFLIDNAHQGKGYGRQTLLALKHFLQLEYPAFDRVYLTVNCQNVAAYRCYEKAGFTDIRELYLGGEAGPQHIMQMQIT